MSPEDSATWGSSEAVALRHELANALVVLSWCADTAIAESAREFMSAATLRVERVLWAMRSLDEPGEAESLQLPDALRAGIGRRVELPRNALRLLLACSPEWSLQENTITGACEVPEAPVYGRVLRELLSSCAADVRWDETRLIVVLPHGS